MRRAFAKSLLIIVFSCLNIGNLLVQGQYYEPGFLRYNDHIYTDNLHTVLLHREGWELSAPWLELGSPDKLRLSFDDLDAGVKNYKFRFIHCDVNWNPSDLLPSDYIEGFHEDHITEYIPSYNTLQPFTHYTIVFPSEQMIPRLSGNYILMVFLDGEENTPLITMRFLIFESLIIMQGRVHAATDINDRKYRQEIDFQLDQAGYIIEQPYRDLHIVVMQNGRWDNAITNLKPKMVRDRTLDYDHEFINTFDGGNEFRHFDLKSLHFNSDRVAVITDRAGSYEVTLHPDIRRPFQVYTRLQDINGRRLVRNDQGYDSRIEAEYVNVSFSLRYDAAITHGDLYVFGALTYWQFQPQAKMAWDPVRRLYKTTLFLKQGYYNYLYALLEDGSTMGDLTFIEGNHEETENDYVILAYNRELGSRYDRLVGLLQLNSLTDR